MVACASLPVHCPGCYRHVLVGAIPGRMTWMYIKRKLVVTGIQVQSSTSGTMAVVWKLIDLQHLVCNAWSAQSSAQE